MVEQPRSDLIASMLRWGSAFALIVSTLTAASAGVEMLPFWDMDPGRQWLPSTGLLPTRQLMCSTIPMLAAAMAMLAAMLSGQRVLWGQALLGAIGSAGVIVHGLMHGPGGLEHLLHASPWIGMAGAWVAAWQLSVRPEFRRLLLAIVAGFVVALLSKGVLQVFFEHPMTVADFKENKQMILGARGWAPGSSNALAYERRLSQAEAIGWFGLSNVYASFTAAGLAGLAAACAAGWKDRHKSRLGLVACGCGAACAAGALWLSGSKGGFGAVGAGLLAAGMLALLWQTRAGWALRVSPWIGPAMIAGVLGMVAARGVVGEALGERSILFRAFYAEGALRIWSEHPLAGVGPAGFQDAYAAAKPPVSPEIVMSPHSVMLDWVSTLGVFGLAWVGLLVWSARNLCGPVNPVVSAASAAGDKASCKVQGRDGRDILDEHAISSRPYVRLIALVVASVTLITLFVERATITPEMAVSRLIGASGWLAVSVGVHDLLCRGRGLVMHWLATASGLTLLAHAQIEVTPVWVNSAMLFGLWIGSATGGQSSCTPEVLPRPCPAGPPSSKSRGRVMASISRLAVVGAWVVLPGLVLGLGQPRVSRWEAKLEEAAEVMHPVAELYTDLQRLIAGDADITAPSLAWRVSATLGVRVYHSPEDIAKKIDLFRARQIPSASKLLIEAVEIRPAHDGTRSAAGRLLLEEGSRLLSVDTVLAVGRFFEAVALAEAGTRANPGSVGVWDWLGVTCERVAELVSEIPGAGIEADRWRQSAWEAWSQCDRLSPHSIRPAVRLMDLAPKVRRADEAPKWANEALRRDELTRLDPLMGLTESQRRRARSIAGKR